MGEFSGVDIGASNTRLASTKGLFATIPNNAVFLEKGTDGMFHLTDLVPYDDSIENCLECFITKKGDEANSMHVLYGSLAERYSPNNIRPSVQEKKYEQRLSYASLLVSSAINRVVHGVGEEFNLYVAVPPVEVKAAESTFREKLIGEWTVLFPKYGMNGTEVKMKIKNVFCYAESHMSSISFFFNLNGSIKEENSKYMSGIVLSINIGASTTDLATIKNGKYIDLSGKTISVGGNIAREHLVGSVAERYGFDLPIDQAERVIAEGRLPMGNTYVDVSDLVDEAKSVLADEIVNKLQFYFKQIHEPIQTMKAIIVSGGGSLRSMYYNENNEEVYTSEPMSSFVTEKLKNWCSTIDVLGYGDEARLADIKGIFIVANLNEKKEEQKIKAQQVVADPVPQVNPVPQNGTPQQTENIGSAAEAVNQ